MRLFPRSNRRIQARGGNRLSSDRNRTGMRGTLRLIGSAAAIALLGAACGNGGSTNSGAKSPTPPKGNANQLVAAGLAAQSHGELDLAVSDYQAALQKDPTNKFAYYDLGVVYQGRNDATNASANYKKALLIDPAYAPALFNLATIEATSDPQGAITLYKQILTANPKDANSAFNLGLLLISTGDTANGKAELTVAVALDPNLKSRVPPGD
jgi:tetratricopeptide (TPR) repeat protein